MKFHKRVRRLKVDPDPEPWDAYAGKITSNGGPVNVFLTRINRN